MTGGEKGLNLYRLRDEDDENSRRRSPLALAASRLGRRGDRLWDLHRLPKWKAVVRSPGSPLAPGDRLSAFFKLWRQLPPTFLFLAKLFLFADSRFFLISLGIMAMHQIKSLSGIMTTTESVVTIVGRRTFAAAAGGKAKKGKGGSADSPKTSTLSKEVKSTTVVGANILKDGADPKVLPDSKYPDWLWHLLDKRTALSELRRKNIETLPYEELKRFVKLDTRARIRENNSEKAKN